MGSLCYCSASPRQGCRSAVMEIRSMRGGSCLAPSGKAERPGFQPTIVLHARVLTGPVGAVCHAGFSFAKGLKRWATRRENSAAVVDFRGDTAGPSRRNLVLEITYSREFVL